MNGGAVHGGLTDDGRIWLNCQQLGVGVTARISPEQADDLAAHLQAWAARARTR